MYSFEVLTMCNQVFEIQADSAEIAERDIERQHNVVVIEVRGW